MDSALQVAVIGLIGALVGGVLQAVFARRHEAAKFQREAKKEIYTDFLSAISAMGTAVPNTTAHDEARTRLVEAKARIALYGSPAVIDNLATFSSYPDLSHEPAKAAFAETIKEMRLDVGEPFDYRFATLVRKILLE
jgi:hypothetical protein